MTARIARITQRAVAALKPGDMLTDDAIKNFTVQRLPSGTVRFGYRYRQNGHQSWSTLGLQQGAADDLTVDQARKAAAIKIGAVAAGHDPVADAAKAKTDFESGRMDNVAARFFKSHVYQNVGAKWTYDYERIFSRFLLPHFGDRQMDDIRRSEVSALFDKITTENGPTMANLTRAAARKFFNWYAARTDGFSSPIVIGMLKTPKPQRISHSFSDDEIRDLWRALDEEPGLRESKRFAAYVKCILLTGQRPGEVANMQADEIDKYHGKPVWKIPANKYKTRRQHWVPLTPAVMQLINPGRNGDYIFSEFRGGSRPISGISKSMDRLRDRLNGWRKTDGRKPMPHWTRHDLRRTARTLMSPARAGVTPDTADRVLGHVLGHIREIYDQHDYFEEKLGALEALARIVGEITSPPTGGNVVKLRKERVLK